MSRVRVEDNIEQWGRDTKTKIDTAGLRMANDIHRTSTILNPVLTGALRDSTRIDRRREGQYRIVVDVPYARRRHFENLKNPQTLRYLRRAGDSVRNNLQRYIR